MVSERELLLDAEKNLISLTRRNDIIIKPSNNSHYDTDINIGEVRLVGEVKSYVNNASYMTNSTGAAILGRMAAYTGQYVTWEEMLASVGDKPSEYSWTATPPTLPDENGRYKIALPGQGLGYLD